jgi:hypothetical protein
MGYLVDQHKMRQNLRSRRILKNARKNEENARKNGKNARKNALKKNKIIIIKYLRTKRAYYARKLSLKLKEMLKIYFYTQNARKKYLNLKNYSVKNSFKYIF